MKNYYVRRLIETAKASEWVYTNTVIFAENAEDALSKASRIYPESWGLHVWNRSESLQF